MSKTNILFLFLGGLPEHEHWNNFLNTRDESLYIIVHPKNLNNYKETIEKNEIYKKMLFNNKLCIIPPEYHIKTKWATSSLAYGMLMMMQYMLITFGQIFKKYVFISMNDYPLYNYKVLYKELTSDNKSWFSYSYNEEYMRSIFLNLYDYEGGIFKQGDVVFASQFCAIDERHIQYYFDMELISKKNITYEKYQEVNCGGNYIDRIKSNSTNSIYQSYLDSQRGIYQDTITKSELEEVIKNGICICIDESIFAAILKLNIEEKNLLQHVRSYKIDDLYNRSKYEFISSVEDEKNNIYYCNNNRNDKTISDYNIWYGSNLGFNLNNDKYVIKIYNNKESKNDNDKYFIVKNNKILSISQQQITNLIDGKLKYEELNGGLDNYMHNNQLHIRSSEPISEIYSDKYTISSTYTDWSIISFIPYNFLRDFNSNLYHPNNISYFDTDVITKIKTQKPIDLINELINKPKPIKILGDNGIGVGILPTYHPIEYDRYSLSEVINTYNIFTFFDITNYKIWYIKYYIYAYDIYFKIITENITHLNKKIHNNKIYYIFKEDIIDEIKKKLYGYRITSHILNNALHYGALFIRKIMNNTNIEKYSKQLFNLQDHVHNLTTSNIRKNIQYNIDFNELNKKHKINSDLNTNILFLFLGDLPEHSHWNKFLSNRDDTLYIVVHPKNLNNYKETIEKNKIYKDMLDKDRLFIIPEEYHIKTQWATAPIAYATLFMIQYMLIKFGEIFKKFVLISQNDFPLYNYNQIYNELISNNKSWFYYSNDYESIRNMYFKLHNYEGGIFKHNDVVFSSQWFTIDSQHIKYYFDMELINKNSETYIKDRDIKCDDNNDYIDKIKSKSKNPQYQSYLDSHKGKWDKEFTKLELQEILENGICINNDESFFAAILKHNIPENKLLDHVNSYKISELEKNSNYEYITPIPNENNNIYYGKNSNKHTSTSLENKIWYGASPHFNKSNYKYSLILFDNKESKNDNDKYLIIKDNKILTISEKKRNDISNEIIKYTDLYGGDIFTQSRNRLNIIDDHKNISEGYPNIYTISSTYTDWSIVNYNPSNMLRDFNSTLFHPNNIPYFKTNIINNIKRLNPIDLITELFKKREPKIIKKGIITILPHYHPAEYDRYSLSEVINTYNIFTFFNIININEWYIKYYIEAYKIYFKIINDIIVENKYYIDIVYYKDKIYYIFNQDIPDEIKNRLYGYPITSHILNNALQYGALFIRKIMNNTNIEKYSDQLFGLTNYVHKITNKKIRTNKPENINLEESYKLYKLKNELIIYTVNLNNNKSYKIISNDNDDDYENEFINKELDKLFIQNRLLNNKMILLFKQLIIQFNLLDYIKIDITDNIINYIITNKINLDNI